MKNIKNGEFLNKKEAYKKAEAIERNLKREIEIVIDYCKAYGNASNEWIDGNFKPALKALSSNEKSPIHRLSQACSHLQIFGGMGSWSDVGVEPKDSKLFETYKEANDFYEECWINQLQ